MELRKNVTAKINGQNRHTIDPSLAGNFREHYPSVKQLYFAPVATCFGA